MRITKDLYEDYKRSPERVTEGVNNICLQFMEFLFLPHTTTDNHQGRKVNSGGTIAEVIVGRELSMGVLHF
jgi:hypothetical protein